MSFLLPSIAEHQALLIGLLSSYQIVGCCLALIVRELFYVPKDFQYGVLVLGIMSNWGKTWSFTAAESGLRILSGNISTAIVSSVTQDKPFNPETDLQLGIAYIAVSLAFPTVAS